MNESRLSLATITLVFVLIAVVVAWQLSPGVTPSKILLSAVLTLPLWAPLRGLLRRERKTYAWATLCVIPYFVLGLTEAVANPRQRLWPFLCVGVAFALFVALILYLRVSNPARSTPSAHA